MHGWFEPVLQLENAPRSQDSALFEPLTGGGAQSYFQRGVPVFMLRWPNVGGRGDTSPASNGIRPSRNSGGTMFARSPRILAALFAASPLLAAPTALAQEGVDRTSPNIKGIAGGALLGAEAVLLVEAALDVEPTWAYIAGGLGGAVAGGVGGYFVEHNTDSGRVPMLMLAGGMLLVIPTTVAVLTATAYEPPAGYVEDRGPMDEPPADPALAPAPLEPAPGPVITPATAPPQGSISRGQSPVAVSTPAPKAHLSRHRLPSLVEVTDETLALGVPAVQVRDVFSAEELHRYGVAQATEYEVPLLSYTF